MSSVVLFFFWPSYLHSVSKNNSVSCTEKLGCPVFCSATVAAVGPDRWLEAIGSLSSESEEE